eukprot:CAMPEP_0170308212 /NCGR_PEP_ID=MMETSP0116_2-20130129/54540_1 /TAXON_ID=400756 /ORGANISM="Durinskia baltica, Strain CSIRO CS-38" /LENGTH=179 /DNA_ID=CAMNT_0010560383 /DNA_START=191 /DNA_END=727 /DNA_ORIENTATION=+
MTAQQALPLPSADAPGLTKPVCLRPLDLGFGWMVGFSGTVSVVTPPNLTTVADSAAAGAGTPSAAAPAGSATAGGAGSSAAADFCVRSAAAASGPLFSGGSPSSAPLAWSFNGRASSPSSRPTGVGDSALPGASARVSRSSRSHPQQAVCPMGSGARARASDVDREAAPCPHPTSRDLS